MEDCIRCDKDWKIIRVDIVKDVGETLALQSLAYDKSVRLEQREFIRVETKVKIAEVGPTVGRIPDGWVHVVRIPELSRGRVEGNLRHVLIGWPIGPDEIVQRKLAEPLEFPVEFSPVAVNRVAGPVSAWGEFDAGDDTIKRALTRKRHGHSQQFIRDSYAAADWNSSGCCCAESCTPDTSRSAAAPFVNASQPPRDHQIA